MLQSISFALGFTMLRLFDWAWQSVSGSLYNIFILSFHSSFKLRLSFIGEKYENSFKSKTY